LLELQGLWTSSILVCDRAGYEFQIAVS